MQSAGQYNDRVTVETAQAANTAAGRELTWTYRKVFTAAVGFLTDSSKPENHSVRDVDVQWVIRSRNRPPLGDDLSAFRFRVRRAKGTKELFLHPLTPPLYSDEEWRVECFEERPQPAALMPEAPPDAFGQPLPLPPRPKPYGGIS